jgi:hypothetical protein
MCARQLQASVGSEGWDCIAEVLTANSIPATGNLVLQKPLQSPSFGLVLRMRREGARKENRLSQNCPGPTLWYLSPSSTCPCKIINLWRIKDKT